MACCSRLKQVFIEVTKESQHNIEEISGRLRKNGVLLMTLSKNKCVTMHACVVFSLSIGFLGHARFALQLSDVIRNS